ncbi:MAG: hypothetical protein GF364_11620 [Candidatus Lokiarchaeota archaeon]|nr:hypothetical protein [Candidatus Lokiarchaeota archaeon]
MAIIKDEMKNLKHDIDKSIEEHKTITQNQKRKLEQIFNEKKDTLIQKLLLNMGFEFI